MNNQKERLRIFNVAQDGYAFALNEETGQTVFLPRQLCFGMDLTAEDVGRHIDCIVGEGAKGPQAITLDWIDEPDMDLSDIEARLDELEKKVEQLSNLV